MPVSSYEAMLCISGKILLNEDKAPLAADIIKKFSFFAFVIHDREIHAKLDYELNEQFCRLDYTTGHSLLVFSLINPNNERVDAYARDRCTQHFIPNGEPTAINSTITALCVANQLGIPKEDLPCIVISKNLGANEFGWIKTSNLTLVDQLTELGFIADRKPNQQLKDVLREIHAINKLDAINEPNYKTIHTSLANALTEVLDLLEINSPNYPPNSAASKRVIVTLQNLYNQIGILKNNLELDPEVERLSERLVMFLAQLPPKNNIVPVPVSNSLENNQPFLESDSFTILKSGEIIHNLLINNNIHVDYDPLFGRGRFDWFPLVLSVSKAFETEMNFSIVHSIRNILGIQFPEHFNKAQFGMDTALLMIKNRNGKVWTINFNEIQEGKWRTPSLGHSLRGVQKFKDKILTEEKSMSPELLDSLISAWKIIIPLRNPAAHTAVVPLETATLIKNTIDNLLNAGHFKVCKDMKNKYRGLSKII